MRRVLTLKERAAEALKVTGCLGLLLAPVVLVAVKTGRYFPAVLGVSAAVLVAVAAGFRFHRALLIRQFQRQFGSRGKVALVVMTESPHWGERIRSLWLPRLGDAAEVLNRSEPWNRRDVRVKLWRALAGPHNHTPLVIVFHTHLAPHVHRFFPAFTLHKHGKSDELTRLESDLFADVERARHGAA